MLFDKGEIEEMAVAAKADPDQFGGLLLASSDLVISRCPESLFEGTLCERSEAPLLALSRMRTTLEWWNPDRGAFTWIIWRYARSWVWREIKHLRSIPGVSLDAPLDGASGVATYADVVADQNAADPSSIFEFDVSVPLHVLKPRSREVIERYYGLNGRPRENTREIGPTRQAAECLIRNALHKLRREINRNRHNQ